MKKSAVFLKTGVVALACILVAAPISEVFARGHWGGRGWGRGGCGGYYNSCRWGLGCGWGYPYYSGYYYGGYPYYGYPRDYVVVETPVVHETTVVTKSRDASTPSPIDTAATVQKQAEPAQKLESAPNDTSSAKQQVSAGDTVTIYVPNSAGRFTPVKLVKRGSGYTGPQGEFYPHSPTVAQLRVLYAY